MAKKTGNSTSTRESAAPESEAIQAPVDGYSAETRWTVTRPDETKRNVMAADESAAIAKVKGQ